jgi:rubrerythrin
VTDPIDGYDPLREQFDRLEREVRARKIQEQRDNCPHERMREIHTVARPIRWICASCGFVTEDRP